jgi:uncharacterized membrane protein YkvA (DUF1232 family)
VIFEVLKQKAKELKKQTLTVYFASRDPSLTMHIKIISIIVVAYALSPIDLIPDFIPIFGLLDDIIIVPLGLALIIHLTPPEIIEAAQIKALQSTERPTSYMAAFIFILIWLIILMLSGQWFYHEFLR